MGGGPAGGESSDSPQGYIRVGGGVRGGITSYDFTHTTFSTVGLAG